jgi:DNA mismatch repair protein MutS
MSTFTPLIEQYLSIKKEHKDSLLFFRLGDFYELFFEDAKIASSVLNIVLTSREAGEGKRVPMCGVPYHSANRYIAKLLEKGYKISICEQLEEPKPGKIVKREVVRIITPGTILEDELLEEKNNNYLISLTSEKNKFGIGIVDISSGDFLTSEIEGLEKTLEEIRKFNASEILLPESFKNSEIEGIIKKQTPATITFYEDYNFEFGYAYNTLISHFKTSSLRGYGIEEMPLSVSACGGLINYLKDTQKLECSNITSLSVYNLTEFMILDSNTMRNLEIISSLKDGKKRGTLLEILDFTKTSMGARLLKRFIEKPLLDVNKIKERQSAVEEFFNNSFLRETLRENLGKIQDIERILSKITYFKLTPRDLISLKNSLKILPEIKNLLENTESELLKKCFLELDTLPDIQKILEDSIREETPNTLKEGGIIKDGYSEEVDRLRNIVYSGKKWISELEQRERERTGIKSLKVGYTSVFGYYIEVTRPNLSLVPSDYIRKQTIASGERFITSDLKEKETQILQAEEELKDLEYQIFLEIREKIVNNSSRIQKTSKIISLLDVLLSFSECAVVNNYVKPEINNSERIKIREGRHPVMEKIQSFNFIPNDTLLDTEENQLLIITGPNMAGKSTYLRQVALIVLMAQIGSFVPARECEIGVVDRIFTRIGAHDDISFGQSTFMVEMTETANILNNATKKSLIVLDEIGRGTSTYDGLSIAWAVAEYISKKLSCRTLFATHYHELTKLAEKNPKIKNYNVAVKEEKDKIIFLYKLTPGGADRSYGIYVARLAGIPNEVLNRAKIILQELENKNIKIKFEQQAKYSSLQLSFFPEEKNNFKDEIENIDIENITPLQALQKLAELKEKIKKEYS